MASLLPNGKQQFSSAAGPMVGGKVYAYDAGTLNPRATYADGAGTVPNTHPIVLDARGEATVYWTGTYKVALYDALNNLVWTVDNVQDVGSAIAAAVAVFSLSTGSALLGFIQAGAGALARTMQAKAREWVSVGDFGATGDGITDDTAAIQAALNSGASHVVIPATASSYRITALSIPAAVREIVTISQPTLTCVAANNRVAITDNAGQFFRCGDLKLVSTGAKGDGLNTVGIQATTKSYQRFGRLRFENFSLAGLRLVQNVFVRVDEVTGNSCTRIISLEKDGGSVPCVNINFGNCYLSGSTYGLYADGVVNLQVDELIMEYSGSSVSVFGALHCLGTRATIRTVYTEANERNFVFVDSPVLLENQYILGATAADSITWVGVPFSERGVTQIGGGGIRTSFLNADNKSNLDLTIGENLVVPVAGGSVAWGKYTVTRTLGTLAATATWETIATLTGQSGDGASRIAYRYSVYGGRADRTTGYDQGTVMNGVIYSDSGAIPAWLRMSGNDLQLNLNSLTYGLDWGLITMISNAIGT